MTDEAGATPTINNQDNGKGADPNQNPSNAANPNEAKPNNGEKAFDESVFDDPRLWQHPRFKSLNDRAKKAELLEKQQAEAEEKTLIEQKKFEELAQKTAAERDEIKSKFTQSMQDNRIITEASKIGVVDVEAVLKLVNRQNIVVDDSGNITGVAEAVQELVAGKPYLKGKSVTIGSPTNPGADNANQPKRFKLSQLQDPVFYRENEKDILTAYKQGLIEDDTHN